jgi:hypothetical protein
MSQDPRQKKGYVSLPAGYWTWTEERQRAWAVDAGKDLQEQISQDPRLSEAANEAAAFVSFSHKSSPKAMK